VYNVRQYGAKGDGKQLDHIAINKAIDACAQAGGGTVSVPAGIYLSGSIHLKSNINLHLDAGATILGAQPEMNAYDPAEPFPFPQYQDGGHTYFHNSLIWGENLNNVSITGRGMINGGGLTKKDKEKSGVVLGGAIETGDKAIALKLCRNVLIKDITIFHGGHFAIIVTGCDLVTLDNLTIDTNRDGIDIDCCTNTVVSNCRVNTPGDDAICLKSSYALNRPVITENVFITNCEVTGYKEGTLIDGKRIPAKAPWSNGRIKFGTESNGGFRNCIVSNCLFRNSNGLALEMVDGGVMENIIVNNLVMEDINHYPIYITLGNRNRGPKETTKTGRVRNIMISNVMVMNADSVSGIQITGLPDQPLENIQLENIHITYKGGGTKEMGLRKFPELGNKYPEPFLLGANPAYGFFARHVKGLKVNNLTVSTARLDQRPAIICEDVQGLRMFDVNATVADGIPAYRFEAVSDVVIRDSPWYETERKKKR
jgi:polygalacturonase